MRHCEVLTEAEECEKIKARRSHLAWWVQLTGKPWFLK